MSGFPRFESRQGLARQQFSDELLTEQSRGNSEPRGFVADRNYPTSKIDSSGAQLRIVIYQTAIPQVRLNLEAALKGHPGISLFLDKQVLREKRLSPNQAPALESLLQPIKQLEKRGHMDAALDVLYDRVDSLLRTKKFAVINEAMADANVDLLSTDVLIGLLTASLPAKSKLPARRSFFANAESSIKSRGEWEAGLLAGLES